MDSPPVAGKTRVEMPGRRNFLTLNDRVRRNGECFRPAERLGQAWVLRHVVDGVMLVDDPDAWHLADEVQQRLRDGRKIAVDEDYFSKAGQLLSSRDDDSEMHDLSDAKLRTVAWKVEWCTRFNRARSGDDGHDARPSRTPKGLEAFIEREREGIHRWYLETFRQTRPPGRRIVGQLQKSYDYPSATTLREWLVDYEQEGHRQKAFRPGYNRCGNRNQLDSRILAIVNRHVDAYASRSDPSKDDIFQDVGGEIELLNRRLPKDAQLAVSERSIRRRIDKLPPMFVDAGRLGTERAARKYTPVGGGLRTHDGLETLERMGRVEMDDWEMDLFTILEEPDVVETLGPKTRAAAKKVNRTVRCTVTVGIDVVTRCIVALNVSPHKPSPGGARRAVDTMFIDKTGWAKLAKAASDWPMFATPREIATDGGAAFEGDFRDSLARLGITHRYPGGNPTSRGHIESFFRSFKRFCRLFTGQAFANVVKRGDYPAEDMASIFAHNLELLIVRFIVDDYHQRPHEGLGGMRPYTAWERSRNEMTDARDETQRLVAFGIRQQGLRIKPTGITFMHVEYKHPKMGLLLGQVGRRELMGIINPNDLGTMLVLVPEEAKSVLDGPGDYIAFKAEDFRGVPLARLEHFNDVMKEFEAQETADGRTIRHEARRFLKREAEAARVLAGRPSDTMNSDQYLKFLGHLDRAGLRASTPRPKPEGKPMTDADEPDTIGVSISRPAGARPMGKPDAPKPPRRSINQYRDEDRS